MAKSSRISRRTFITSTLTASSGLALSGLVPLESAAAGALSNQLLFGNNALTISIDDYAELKEDGGFKVIKEVTIGDITDSIIIVRKSEKEFLVYSSVCRHKKCNVKFKKDRDVFVCPCHGSTYDIEGKVIKGPSEKDIPPYKVKLAGTKLEIYT